MSASSKKAFALRLDPALYAAIERMAAAATLVPVALTILLTVGGIPSIYYGDEQGFTGVRGESWSADDAVRATFVENLVDYLVAHDYDGVDVDWENCIGGEAWECGIDISVDEYRAAWREAMKMKESLVDVSPSMVMRLKDRSAASFTSAGSRS